MPVALSEGEHELSVLVEEGAVYVLHVAGQAGAAEFETTLQLDVSDSTAPPPAHPRYYTNIANALDTTADGVVYPRDALVVVNSLNRHGAVSTEQGLMFLDVTGDEILSPRDALSVINYLNAGGSGSGEGEGEGSSLVASATGTTESFATSTKFYVVDNVPLKKASPALRVRNSSLHIDNARLSAALAVDRNNRGLSYTVGASANRIAGLQLIIDNPAKLNWMNYSVGIRPAAAAESPGTRR
jgi:hypothetical protein